MKYALIIVLVLAVPFCMLAQESGGSISLQTQVAGPVVTYGMGVFGKGVGAPVQGAPYSATSTNENIQTLADGTRIVQSSSGSIARDSQGRTRQDTPLPTIGNLSAGDAPHLVFIQDPVAQTAYTLNLTDKTAQKMPSPPARMDMGTPGPGIAGGKVIMQSMSGSVAGAMSLPEPPSQGIMVQRTFTAADPGKATTEDLGTQTMEGVLVTGVRMTRTIPTGEIGNDKPINIVTEVWTSPDLKTIVYSKRSDPRMGEQTFQLTNLVRSEPDAALFTVPPDFKIVEGPQNVIYRSNQ